MMSCERVGVSPIILGWQEAFLGNVYRLQLIHRFLESDPDEYAVVFTDAFDSILVKGTDEILTSFLEIGSSFLISGSAQCWPYADKAKLFPYCDTPYRFLNGGGWIGFKRSVIGLLESLRIPDLPDDHEDQAVWTDAFLTGKLPISIDHKCRIFQTLHGVSDHVDCSDGVRNRITGTKPMIVHGNSMSDLSGCFRALGL